MVFYAHHIACSFRFFIDSVVFADTCITRGSSHHASPTTFTQAAQTCVAKHFPTHDLCPVVPRLLCTLFTRSDASSQP